MNIVEKNTVFWAKKHPNAIIPSKRIEDAGYDIRLCYDGDQDILILPNHNVILNTGLSCAYHHSKVMTAWEKSTTGSLNASLRMGIIDSGYRGEIKVCINNTGNKPIIITKDESLKNKEGKYKEKKLIDKILYPYSKAICQVVFLEKPEMEVSEISYEDLLKIPSQRGNGMIGSTD